MEIPHDVDEFGFDQTEPRDIPDPHCNCNICQERKTITESSVIATPDHAVAYTTLYYPTCGETKEVVASDGRKKPTP